MDLAAKVLMLHLYKAEKPIACLQCLYACVCVSVPKGIHIKLLMSTKHEVTTVITFVQYCIDGYVLNGSCMAG